MPNLRNLSGLLFVLFCSVDLILLAQTVDQPARAVTDPGVVTTRQTITPAGVQSVFDGRVYGLSFGRTSADLWVLQGRRSTPRMQIVNLDWRANRTKSRLTSDDSPGLQGIRYDRRSDQVLVSATLPPRPGGRSRVRLLRASSGATKAETAVDGLGQFLAGSIAIAANPGSAGAAGSAGSGGERLAVVPLIYDNQLALVDLHTDRVIDRIPVGIAPFGAAINANGTVAYVTNWGGRLPRPGDSTLPTGLDPKADRVVIDRNGIASTGTVSRVDLVKRQVTATITVGLHPTAIVWDEASQRLFVANGNQESVSVIDTRTSRVVDTFYLQPFHIRVPGIAPTALALSADGRLLFVACGGINAVAVLDVRTGRTEGLIPTAWYPNGLTLSPDGQYLAVSTLLGPGSGWDGNPRQRFVHANRGSISVVPIPDAAQLASYTAAVIENNHMAPPASRSEALAKSRRAQPSPLAIPRRSGDPSPIEHVVYIIKENRTYDQLFGDLPKGNGDPSLVMFGADVTPNHRRLADQFVLLDNFFATGGNSGDGHQWLTQANETDYCLWPGYAGRSYPYDGTDPIAYSAGGFIWDAALRMRKSVRVYGEFAGRMAEDNPDIRSNLLKRWRNGEDFTRDWNVTAPLEPLNKILARNFPPYTQAIPDVVRAQIFLADLQKWEVAGKMPNLVIMLLPSDHTRGATPEYSSAKAMVADNDLALGKVVDALSHSPFWKKMAIFVVEDDAQAGVDHVDGHRTIALAISPWIRRGHVDSTFYSHPSLLKTIELILGLPTLSLFDLIANDLRASFTDQPDFTPYSHETPRQSIFEVNPRLSTLRGQARRDALASMQMRFDVPDAAPTEKLNRIVWRQVRGFRTPYPVIKRAIFAPMSIDKDDDDEQGRGSPR
jgi:DNA-binding beta-propeller fold protein YncE